MVVAEWAMVGCESTQSTDNVISISPASVTVPNDGATLAALKWTPVIFHRNLNRNRNPLPQSGL